MAATPSTMLPLGTRLPTFELKDSVSGATFHSASLAGSPALVAFICNHCPFVKHVAGELASLGRDCAERGVQLVAISANDVERYPADAPDAMKQEAAKQSWPFPYLFDESQDVAKAFRAACTPEFYLFDTKSELVYRGQLDDSRPENGVPVTGKDLRAAIDAVLVGGKPAPDQRPSVGCNIKWKPGNEPAY